MANREHTGERDLTISGWHRSAFSDDAVAFDLDLVGLCPRCRAHLYVIEATRSDQKWTTWTQLTALRLNVPGFLIRYSQNGDLSLREMRTEQIHPQPTRLIGNREATETHFVRLRASHLFDVHGRTS